MAPYAGDNTTMMVQTREEMHDAYYAADVQKPITEDGADNNAADDATANESTEESPNKFDFVFDFNPCHSMSSALFKERTCSYCGHKCSKLQGYKKEVVESSTGEIEKVYLHKFCSQLKEWKAVHAVQWSEVMGSMMANFHAAERAVVEERTRQEEAMRKALETSLVTQMEDADEASIRSVGGAASNGFGRRVSQKLKALKSILGCKGNATEAVDSKATRA